MSLNFGRSFAALVGSLLIVTGCISVAPAGSNAPTGPAVTLAPGATATAAPAITPAPGVTVPPVTVAPVDTSQPTTEPPATSPPTDAPPTGEHPGWPPGAIQPNESAEYVGSVMTVCGKVNGANWVFAEPGHPTWLNLGPAYPNQKFNVVIWGEQRREWPVGGKPDVVYLNQVICVTGMIQQYSGWYQIQDVSKADIQVIP